MKILCLLHPLLHDYQISGAAMFAVSVGEYINNHYDNITVDYIASDDIYNILDKNNTKATIYIPENIRKSRSTLDTFNYAKKVFLENNYDLIHNNIAQMSTLSAINNILDGIPVVHTQHTASISGRFSLNYKDDAKILSNKSNVRVVCPSESMRNLWNEYIEHGLDNSVSVVRNGVRVYNDLKRELTADQSDYYFTVGRLEPDKGMLEIAKLCDKYNHRIVFVAGKSQGTMKVTEDLQRYFDEFDEICDRRKDIITKFDYLPNKLIHKFMINSKGYISLSNLEACPLAIAEATSVGTPLLFLEESATGEFANDTTSVMIPREAIYRKAMKTRIDIYESYFQEFERKLNEGLITNDNVLKYAKTLGLTVADCAEGYLNIYKELTNL